jgi:NADP-dependent 3-hydroxy acid dehydrogenase YdfG
LTLADSVVVVTGAGRGLGRHVALALAGRGARLALAGRDGTDLAAVAGEIAAAGGRALAVPTDVSQWPEVAALHDAVRARLGPADVLINNAGVGWYRPFVDCSREEVERTLDVNLKGTIYVTRAFLPDMLERGRGQVLCVASDLGRRILPNMAVYTASKHGVMGFAGALLREVKDRGVKVMTISPGMLDTYFADGREGTHEAAVALAPAFVAEWMVRMLEAPEEWVVDDLTLHPLGQEF